MKKVLILEIVAAVIWSGVIFWFSHIPDLSSGLKQDFVLRKIAHAAEYAILAFLYWRLIKRLITEKYAVAVSSATALIYALSDEYHQSFVRGRSGNLRDVFIDGTGILIMLIILKKRAK